VLARLPARVAAGGHRLLLESRRQQMAQLIRARLDRNRAELASKGRTLANLSPRRVLERGYSITMIKGSTRPLKRPDDAQTGAILITRLAGGELRSLVADRPARRRRAGSSRETQPSLFGDASDQSGDRHDSD
jgi:exonuclease VII large subunit